MVLRVLVAKKSSTFLFVAKAGLSAGTYLNTDAMEERSVEVCCTILIVLD